MLTDIQACGYCTQVLTETTTTKGSKTMASILTIMTVAAATLEQGPSELMVQLWQLCTSTLGRKFRALSDGVVVPSDVRERLLLANDRDMSSSILSRNSMIFRGGADLTWDAVFTFSAAIPTKCADWLEQGGAAMVDGANVAFMGAQGILSPDLYGTLCQLATLDIDLTHVTVRGDTAGLNYGGIRTLHLVADEYRAELGALGITTSADEYAKALYAAKDADAHTGQVPVQFTLDADVTAPGDAFFLVRLLVALQGRAMFTAPGSFNPGSCKHNDSDPVASVGDMLREIRITAGTMSQGSARGDKAICHPAAQRMALHASGDTYTRRTL
jgi:hypothetical protein